MWLAFKFHRDFIQIKFGQTSHCDVSCWHHPSWQGQRTKPVGWEVQWTQHFMQWVRELGLCSDIRQFQTEIRNYFLIFLWISPYWSHPLTAAAAFPENAAQWAALQITQFRALCGLLFSYFQTLLDRAYLLSSQKQQHWMQQRKNSLEKITWHFDFPPRNNWSHL